MKWNSGDRAGESSITSWDGKIEEAESGEHYRLTAADFGIDAAAGKSAVYPAGRKMCGWRQSRIFTALLLLRRGSGGYGKFDKSFDV